VCSEEDVVDDIALVAALVRTRFLKELLRLLKGCV
jgi:hypothetical protein